MAPPPPTTTTPRHPAPQAVDAVDPTDDESIDSDDAFNSDDERVYGSFFPGGPTKTKKRRRRSSHDDDDDDDDDGDGSEDSDGKSDEVEEEESDDSDDDSSDDGLAGSDDSDDDDAEGDGGQYMLDLLDRLDDGKKSSTSSSAHDGGLKAAAAAAAVLPESEFAAPPSAGGGTGGKGELTLDSLLTPLATTRKFASVQATLRDVSGADDRRLLPRGGPTTKKKKLETTQAPAPKVVSDRASRKVHYAAATDDAKLWTEAVKANREAETLDFRPKGRLRVTRDELVGKFEPTTDFEREIVDALDAAQGGTQDEHALAQRERDALLNPDDDDDDDLGVHQLTVAELKKRHGQLAKLRALLFYHEQKRHRINKIKSKKYRKIRKRQRDRRKESETTAALQEGGDEADELARELQEREEMERMKERMTLAHKNTSKWARRVLRRGGNVDVETRRALSLQIAKGDELRKKMMGDDDDDDGSGDDDDDGDEADLIEQARKVLQETEKERDGGGGGAGKEKGLFQLSFMKRGVEAQRARAKEEARRLLRELESNEAANASDDDDDDNDGDRKDSNAANGEGAAEKKEKSKKKKTASAAEVDQVLPSGKYVASSLRFGKSDGFSVAVGGGIDVQLDDADADAAGTMGGGGDASSAAAAAAASDSGGKNDVPTEQAAAAAAQNGKKKRKNRRKRGKKAADGGNDQGAPSGGSSGGGGDHTADVTLSAIDASSSAGADASEEKEKTRATTASVAGAGSKRPRTEEEGDEDEPESNPWIARADDGKEEDDGAGPTSGNSVKKRKKAKRQRKATTAGVTRDGIVDAGGAADLLDGGGGAVGEDDGDGKVTGDGAASGIAGLSQEQLVRRAFAAPDAAEVEEEFEKEKEAMRGRDDPTRKKVEEKVVSGWGSWAGEGAPPPRRKSRKLPKHLQPPEKKAPEGRKRKDDGLKRVIINEKRVKKTANKFQLANIPYPYSSREQYERAMSGALGQEWNVTSGVKEMTRPEIIVRSGKIIQPLSIKAKAKPKRAPAKF